MVTDRSGLLIVCCVTAPFSLYFQSLFCPNTRVTATLSPHSPHRALRLSWLSHTPPRTKKSIMEQNPGDEGFRRMKEEHRYVGTKEKASGALPMACHSKGEPVTVLTRCGHRCCSRCHRWTHLCHTPGAGSWGTGPGPSHPSPSWLGIYCSQATKKQQHQTWGRPHPPIKIKFHHNLLPRL